MESGFWELLTEKKAIAGQNQGHRKSQACLKLLTRIGEPQTAASHPWGALCLLCHSYTPSDFILPTLLSSFFWLALVKKSFLGLFPTSLF